MKLRTLSLASALALAACASTEPNVTLRDAQGNYVTTADYEAMQRTDFMASMHAGLDDFDAQLHDLRGRANELGGDALKQFADCEESLREDRTEFVNQLEIAKNSLDGDWPDERSRTVDQYVDLREHLDSAMKEVLES